MRRLCLGQPTLEIKVFDAGHGVPVAHAEEIVDFVGGVRGCSVNSR
jgi:hypothetical protein